MTSRASFEQLEPHGCFFGLLSLTLSLNCFPCFKVFLNNIMDISVYFSVTKQGKVWLLFSVISFSNQTWWKDCHIDKKRKKISLLKIHFNLVTNWEANMLYKCSEHSGCKANFLFLRAQLIQHRVSNISPLSVHCIKIFDYITLNSVTLEHFALCSFCLHIFNKVTVLFSILFGEKVVIHLITRHLAVSLPLLWSFL